MVTHVQCICVNMYTHMYTYMCLLLPQDRASKLVGFRLEKHMDKIREQYNAQREEEEIKKQHYHSPHRLAPLLLSGRGSQWVCVLTGPVIPLRRTRTTTGILTTTPRAALHLATPLRGPQSLSHRRCIHPLWPLVPMWPHVRRSPLDLMWPLVRRSPLVQMWPHVRRSPLDLMWPLVLT